MTVGALALAVTLAGGAAGDGVQALEAFAAAVHRARARTEQQGGALDPGEVVDLKRAAAAVDPEGRGVSSELEVLLAGQGGGVQESAGLARLEQRARALASVAKVKVAGPRPGAGDPRAVLDAVLARREFRRAHAKKPHPRSLPDSWAALMERFRDWVNSLRSERDGAGFGSALSGGSVVWALLGTLLVIVVLAALGSLRPPGDTKRLARRADATSADTAAEALARAPDDWLALAERLLAAGDRGGAVRALYLALLASLHRSGAIELCASRTNWEHAQRLGATTPAAAEPLRELTRLFDRVVYGRIEPDRADYERARVLAESVRESVVGRMRVAS